MVDLPDPVRSEIAIIELTNAFRGGQKLGRVVRNGRLDAAAKAFAEYLARTDRFAHEADGREPADRVKSAGYRYCTVAENLALNLDSRGFKSDQLAAQVMEGWKNSPGHRHNLELPQVTEIGVGIARAPGPEPKYLSVQLFGRPDSLLFSFQVINKSTSPVTYTIAGKSQAIEPRVIITHKACEPAALVFERAGGWLGGTKLGARFETRSGARYVITSSADGKVHVDVEK